jgi:cystathionine beta-lyase
MNYNFDEQIDRSESHCIKHDKMPVFFGRKDLQPLWVADMDFATPDFIIEALQKRLEHPILGYTLRTSNFNKSFINWNLKRNQWQLQESWLDFSPGVVSALAVAILALTNENDKIIIQTPVYHPFFDVVEGNGRQLLQNPLKVDAHGDYQMDFEHLKTLIDTQTKMIIISNPHNPVGRVWTREELTELGKIALENNLIILSDDIHSDFIYKTHKYTPIASISEELAQNTITITAPSKTFNVAGLATSVVIIPNEKIKAKYNKKLFDMHLFLGNIFGAIAFETAYSQGEDWLEQLLAYLSNNIEFVVDYLQENIPAIKAKKPDGTFLMWLNFKETGLSHQQIKDKLINEAKLALNDGMSFGKTGEYYFRLNIATTKHNVLTALEKLKKVFDK